MKLLLDGLREAFDLLIALDPSVMAAAWRSLWISTAAVALAAVLGLSSGTALARISFAGKRVLITLVRGAMAVPTVFIGVVCYAVFSRRGPLGPMELLYSPWGIVIGEFLLAFPIVVAITHGAVQSLDPRVWETVRTLGAGPIRRGFTYLSEARSGVLLAVLTAFTRCVTELGIAMMVGGNIKDRTRTLATATALEAGKGEFARGLAMGFLLLAISLAVMSIVALIGREERK